MAEITLNKLRFLFCLFKFIVLQHPYVAAALQRAAFFFSHAARRRPLLHGGGGNVHLPQHLAQQSRPQPPPSKTAPFCAAGWAKGSGRMSRGASLMRFRLGSEPSRSSTASTA